LPPDQLQLDYSQKVAVLKRYLEISSKDNNSVDSSLELAKDIFSNNSPYQDSFMISFIIWQCVLRVHGERFKNLFI
jgi:hypothetical protein